MLERIDGESRAYSAKIFESIEDERRRIGRELHDETSQSLAAALLNLDLADEGLGAAAPGRSERVANARRSHPHCLDADQAPRLRPAPLDARRLRARAVAALVRAVASTSLPGSRSRPIFEAADCACPSEVETALYRIAQESLANVVKHSGATRATLRLETQARATRVLAVSDNGRRLRPGGRDPRRRGALRRRPAVHAGSAPSCSRDGDASRRARGSAARGPRRRSRSRR